ncbi:hypothetical protein [Mesorhizobium sp. M1B.F.Ca.ET.045.04.1.1]|uniref:hypothetical protein n=1 Tax=Mesorhizobium sp. M1B.F.Ca.ET.045.04.1.1 TaxID=2493673 RepID=UPI000F7642EB|nr:hypothetical protein [Mesorhizobium sp. M1B.F.Ca.ET.045.04.1.1]AZO29805.1 hypothetical protein EJ071_21980 [Mesorhizobium sp. M1B.F.Ca.ET.045.04.1.1]
MGTVTAGGGGKSAIVTAWLAKYYGGVVGQPADSPTGTVTCIDHHALVTGKLVKVEQAANDNSEKVHAFLIKYQGTDQDPRLDEPLHTVTTRDRFGLVTVHGELYRIVDIRMRMLKPSELFLAMDFPRQYIIDHTALGKLSSKLQVQMCGNSVPPTLPYLIISLNVARSALFEMAA